MRVLVAFDKFKYALSARHACEAAAKALRARHPDWQLDLCPLTDGGEGFTEILTDALGGRYESRSVTGPRQSNVVASVGYLSSGNLAASVRERLQLGTEMTLAVVGLASTSGLELLAPDQRDPWQTTTRGIGELMQMTRAGKIGAILLGVGGSATNDLGLGALTAVGLECIRKDGSPCAVPIPASWSEISKITGTVDLPPIFIACDVANPLLGPHGATATFGRQKGLLLSDVPHLEAEMARMAALLCAACDKSFSLTNAPGTGAAGGIAFGLMVAADAKLIPGFDLVSDWLDLPARIAAADLVLTGEGRFDATSLNGKGPGALLATAQRLGKPAHIFAGSLGLADDAYFHSITPYKMPLTEALSRAAELLEASVRAVF
jgi:glycerate kinase